MEPFIERPSKIYICRSKNACSLKSRNYYERPQIFHQLIVEACTTQDSQSLVPFAKGLELDAVIVIIIVIVQLLEEISIIA